MKKKNLKYEKGITLIVLIMTVIVLLILTGTVISEIGSSNQVATRNKMYADINLLKDKVLIYYNKYEELPKTDLVNRTKRINGVDYFEIDLSELDNITLNFGKEYGKTEPLTDTADVYVVNNNLEIYYLKGVNVSGTTYHN